MPGLLVPGGGVPDQDDRHGDGRGGRELAEHLLVVGVAEPVTRRRQREPRQPVDLLIGRERGVPSGIIRSARSLPRRPCRPVLHLLGLAVADVVSRAQPPAECDPDPGLLAHLSYGRDQHMLTGQRLALGEAPVAITGPVDERHLRPLLGGPPQQRPGGADLRGLVPVSHQQLCRACWRAGAVAGHAGAGRRSPGDAGSRCHRRPATTTRWSRPWPAR